MELIDKFAAIADMLFGGIFAAILLALVVLGVLVGRSSSRKWIAAGILVLGIIGTYGWSMMFVFPYPPNAPTTTWMMAGWALTGPARDHLRDNPDIAGFDAERRYGELVFASGGDVQKVWEGRSMAIPKFTGQAFLALIVFGLAWTLTLLGVGLIGAKPKDSGG
ncbi:MAG: hypothetical protein F9K43_04770 [Bauldia sp.]|nr:MAG: hypothetical protein F9K43_04770 [Bauldia sp.]